MGTRLFSIHTRPLSSPEPAMPGVDALTASERIALLGTLSEEAWLLTGRPVPDYVRAETPVTKRHLRERAVDASA